MNYLTKPFKEVFYLSFDGMIDDGCPGYKCPEDDPYLEEIRIKFSNFMLNATLNRGMHNQFQIFSYKKGHPGSSGYPNYITFYIGVEMSGDDSLVIGLLREFCLYNKLPLDTDKIIIINVKQGYKFILDVHRRRGYVRIKKATGYDISPEVEMPDSLRRMLRSNFDKYWGETFSIDDFNDKLSTTYEVCSNELTDSIIKEDRLFFKALFDLQFEMECGNI